MTEALKTWFEGFAQHAPSELYRRLSASVAQAPDVIEQLLVAAPAQQLPMLLFAAVHLEVLRRGEPYPADGPAFIAFCREHRAALEPTLATRSTQTNEVNRCAYLRPAISLVSDGRPLALIEVGASAGMNLNLDRYAYDYGAGRRAGPVDATVRVECELRLGDPPLELPEIAWRRGIDLAPKPDPEWLRACVFADQPDRLERLEAALAVAEEHPPQVIRGDALELLPEVVAQAPDGTQPVVFHTAVAMYLTDAQRERLAAVTAGMTHVAAELGDPDGGLILEAGGATVGRAHAHGRWLEWQPRVPSPVHGD